MNVGFAEANALTCSLKKILREAAPVEGLETYNNDWHQQWTRLLGLKGGLKSSGEADSWVARRRERLLPCLPGYGLDLASLTGQLGLALA